MFSTLLVWVYPLCDAGKFQAADVCLETMEAVLLVGPLPLDSAA